MRGREWKGEVAEEREEMRRERVRRRDNSSSRVLLRGEGNRGEDKRRM